MRSPLGKLRQAVLPFALGGIAAGCAGGGTVAPGSAICRDDGYHMAKSLGDNQTAAPGATVSPLTVQLTCTQDAEPAPVEVAVEDAVIEWTANAGNFAGDVTAQSATNAAGSAGIVWTLGPAEGPQTAVATYKDTSGAIEATVTFTANAATPGPCDGGTAHVTDIGSSETWAAAAGPHRLPGSISARGDGVVLTIDPGAIVCGESAGSGLFLETGARIVAEGTAASPIQFLTKDGVSGWAGVVMNGAPTAASSLKHVVAERASIRGGPTHPFVLEDATILAAFFTAVDLAAPASRATRVVINQPAVDGAQIGGNGTTFEGRVTGAGRYGVILSTGPTDAVTLQNCEVTGGADHGIFAGAFGELTITGCNIFDNAGNGVQEVSSALVVHAQGNWWGDPAGPAGPSGDGVSGDVDASNPLAAPVTLGY